MDLFIGSLLWADGAMPTFDGAYWLALISRFVHIMSAIVLLGGVAYLRKVVVAGTSAADGDPADTLFAGRRAAWAKWVGISTALLLLTGFYNFFGVIREHEKLPGAYHMAFGLKFLLALLFFFLAAILAGKTEAASRFRGSAKRWLTISLLIGGLIVLIASFMRSIPHIPKGDSGPVAETVQDATPLEETETEETE